jgi:hypothetical protein
VPSNSEVSPRVRTAFSDVRKRVLPGIIQQRYTNAKAAYDRKDFVFASAEFQRVLAALSDPDVGAASGRPPLSDIKTLATGFHELSVAAAAPPPPPEPIKPPVPEPAPLVAALPPAPPPVAPKRLQPYGPDDTNVVPPAVLNQRLPDFQIKVTQNARPGVLEVLIGEDGNVESAAMRAPIHPQYDPLVIAAARAWRYRPATVDGKPVKYRKLIAISVKP